MLLVYLSRLVDRFMTTPMTSSRYRHLKSCFYSLFIFIVSALPIIFHYEAVEAENAEYIGGVSFILVSSAIGMILVIDLATLQVSPAVLAIYDGIKRSLQNC